MEYQRNFDLFVNKNLNKYVRKPEIVYGIIVLLLVLYSAQIAPKLPVYVTRIFDNTFFKLFIFVLILWVAQISPSLSILISVAFLMLMNYVNNKGLFEFLENTASATTVAPVTIEPTHIDAIKAVTTLGTQALSESSAKIESVKAATETIQSVIPPTPENVKAVSTLIDNALAPKAGDVKEVRDAVHTINHSINDNVTPATVTPSATAQALGELVTAATTPGTNNTAVVATAANVITTAAPVTTPAVTELVTKASQSADTPVNVEAVKQTAQSIVDTIATTPAPAAPTTTAAPVPMAPELSAAPIKEIQTPAAPAAAPASGCYPMRHIDMSNVKPIYENVAIEDYQTFTSSM